MYVKLQLPSGAAVPGILYSVSKQYLQRQKCIAYASNDIFLAVLFFLSRDFCHFLY